MSGLTEYARRVPPKVLQAHRVTGSTLIVLSCLLLAFSLYAVFGRSFLSAIVLSGFVAFPFTIATGATGLAGGVGRSTTLCCIITCIVLGPLTTVMNLVGLVFSSIAVDNAIKAGIGVYLHFIDIGYIVAFLMATLAAAIQTGYAIQASCCCVPAASPDMEMRAGHPAQSAAPTGQGKPPPTYDNAGMRNQY